ncbi:hypothetical protein GN241_08720 [Rhodobacteraceae bacterium IMCC1335]
MTTLSKLNLTTVTRVSRTNPKLQRRKKLVSAIQQQLSVHAALLRNEVFTVTKQSSVKSADGKKLKVDKEVEVKKWFFEEGNKWFVQCKYGTKVLLLNGKDNAVAVADVKEVASVLRTLQVAVENGDLDSAVANALQRKS